MLRPHAIEVLSAGSLGLPEPAEDAPEQIIPAAAG